MLLPGEVSCERFSEAGDFRRMMSEECHGGDVEGAGASHCGRAAALGPPDVRGRWRAVAMVSREMLWALSAALWATLVLLLRLATCVCAAALRRCGGPQEMSRSPLLEEAGAAGPDIEAGVGDPRTPPRAQCAMDVTDPVAARRPTRPTSHMAEEPAAVCVAAPASGAEDGQGVEASTEPFSPSCLTPPCSTAISGSRSCPEQCLRQLSAEARAVHGCADEVHADVPARPDTCTWLASTRSSIGCSSSSSTEEPPCHSDPPRLQGGATLRGPRRQPPQRRSLAFTPQKAPRPSPRFASAAARSPCDPRLAEALQRLGLTLDDVTSGKGFLHMTPKELIIEQGRVQLELERFVQDFSDRVGRPPRSIEREPVGALYCYVERLKEAVAAVSSVNLFPAAKRRPGCASAPLGAAAPHGRAGAAGRKPCSAGEARGPWR
mmetsp:Transcript_35121/g.99980  ORF Transcript_35121/g.99980 Transcript_35121/m.99980 type:complete len:435 (+) Transcript_35121:43-1347(+)